MGAKSHELEDSGRAEVPIESDSTPLGRVQQFSYKRVKQEGQLVRARFTVSGLQQLLLDADSNFARVKTLCDGL